MAKVLVCGIAVVDFVFQTSDIPTLPQKYRADAIEVVGGGIAANAAVAIARLGGTAQLMTRLGQDAIGDMIQADEAKDMGLVDMVIPADELREQTLKLANQIAAQSPLTLRVAKEAVRASERLAIEEGILYERDLFCLCFSTEDKAEGVDAFLNKRAPEWKNR